MNKLLLDSNIIIGLGKNRFPMEIVQNHLSYVSEITRLEVFGYHQIKMQEELLLNQFFGNITCIAISKSLIDKSIKLRKEKAMCIGDAIIGATAILEDLPIVLANIKDFQHIKGLELIDPVSI
jgi:hypothetical protein